MQVLSLIASRLTAVVFVWFFSLLTFGQSAAQESNETDYKIQGEYTGTLDIEGQKVKFAIQVIALGKEKFTGVAYVGGLPGDGWDGEDTPPVENIALSDDEDKILKFETDDGVALISDGVATIKDRADKVLGHLKRVVRKSRTLGKRPTEKAVVLFDGKSVDNWELRGKPGRMTDDGLLKQGTASKMRFQSHNIHIEFLLPFHPEARGQQRSNSGIYVQGRYEVQMLDSFGLSGEQNECGGIYSIRKPDVNMCFPPLQWQTYDIQFHAAQYDGKKKTKNAWMKVEHNGVTIHEKVELPNSTTASPLKEGPEPGFVYLQDHGQEVRYRNIWVEVTDHADAEMDSNAATTKTETPLQSKQKLDVSHPVTMDYLLSLPTDYKSKEKWPLVLFLHGAGERGDDLNLVKKHGPPKLVENGKKFPFILVSPQCKTNRWWEPVSLTALLDDIEKKHNVDKDRIYVTGLSMGGFGTWSLAAHTPERFAAIAPICGGADSMRTAYSIGNQIPIWVFHGAKDNVVPLKRSEELVESFKKSGVEVKFTIYPDAGHDSWTETYNNEEFYKWMLSQTNEK